MPSPDELIRAGDLAAARAALVDEVRARPDHRPARMFLSQVQLLLGEWDKALTHMKALAGLSPEALTLFTAYDRLVTAEKTRESVFAGQAAPVALEDGGPWFDALVSALAADIKGDAGAAASLREQAFNDAPDTPGDVDGHRFSFIADADARFGPSLEAMLDGRYGLIPFEAIASLESDGAKDLRDLVWLPARLTLKSGKAGHVFIPTRYPGAPSSPDPLVKLARKTEWTGRADLGNAGAGQRLLDAEGHEVALLDLRRLIFDA
jgi:type VI secretion system protein ImpE